MKKIYLLICFLAVVKFSIGQERTTYTSSPNFFPISVWLQAPYDIQTYKNMGVNIYNGLSWGDLDQNQLNTLHQYGMYVMPSAGDAFAWSHRTDTLIYGWLLTDEPDNAQWNATTSTYDSCINPKIIIHQYDSIKLADPAHPIYYGLGQGVSYTTWNGRGPCYNWLDSYPVYKNGYVKGCDITGYDIYPVNNTDATTGGKLWYVAKGVDSLLLWSSQTASPRVPSKPVWMAIETTKITSSSAAGPTPAQTKSEVWMAIIHGAKGITYFPDSWIPSFSADALLSNTAMVSTLTSVDSMIKALAPVINSSNTGYATNVNANTAGVTSSNGTVFMNYMTKTYKGSTYIFAVAMRSGTTTATFTVSSGTTVTVLGENRSIPIASGKFSDSFSGYGVHIYKINTATSVNEIKTNQNVNIYPNPFNNSTNIIFNDAEKHFVELYDVTGRKLNSIQCNELRYELSRNGLAPGIYFIKIYDTKMNIISTSKINIID